MSDLYREIIVENYRHPKNFGHLKKPDVVYEKANTLCGDKMRIELSIDKKTKKVSDIKFSGEGCAISIATASMLTAKLKGQSISFLQSLSKDDILKIIGIDLSPTRLKCALLPLEAIQEAIGR